jgi:catechol 2,3-dioxygenase-like lactoylglutathione lyase family enzyme
MRGDHAGLRVPDLAAALDWYRDKLDFRLTATLEAAGLEWAFLAPAAAADFQIELAAGPGAVDRPVWKSFPDTLALHGWHHLCLRVDDVDATVAELRRRDVTIVAGPVDYPEIFERGAFFTDPWGNLIELMATLPDSDAQAALSTLSKARSPHD